MACKLSVNPKLSKPERWSGRTERFLLRQSSLSIFPTFEEPYSKRKALLRSPQPAFSGILSDFIKNGVRFHAFFTFLNVEEIVQIYEYLIDVFFILSRFLSERGLFVKSSTVLLVLKAPVRMILL